MTISLVVAKISLLLRHKLFLLLIKDSRYKSSIGSCSKVVSINAQKGLLLLDENKYSLTYKSIIS